MHVVKAESVRDEEAILLRRAPVTQRDVLLVAPDGALQHEEVAGAEAACQPDVGT